MKRLSRRRGGLFICLQRRLPAGFRVPGADVPGMRGGRPPRAPDCPTIHRLIRECLRAGAVRGSRFSVGAAGRGWGRSCRRHRLCVYQSGAARPAFPRPGRTMSAFSVCNALWFKSYSLLFCAKTVVFPLTSGRAALCCRLAFCLFQWQHALVAAFFPASGWRRQNLKMALS